MSDNTLSAFLAENALTVEHVKFAASPRFLDSKKKPMLWEIKTISATEDEALRKACAKRVPIPGKRNQYQKETDYDMYLGKLSYHVMGGEALLKAMLTPGEYADYVSKIQEVCGFDTTLQEDVDEAKN